MYGGLCCVAFTIKDGKNRLSTSFTYESLLK